MRNWNRSSGLKLLIPNAIMHWTKTLTIISKRFQKAYIHYQWALFLLYAFKTQTAAFSWKADFYYLKLLGVHSFFVGHPFFIIVKECINSSQKVWTQFTMLTNIITKIFPSSSLDTQVCQNVCRSICLCSGAHKYLFFESLIKWWKLVQ